MQPGNPRPLVVRMFIGRFGLRTPWRITMFFLLSLLLGAILQYPTRRWPFEVWSLGVLGATWIMARIDGQPFGSFGFGAMHRRRNLLSGLAAGFVALSLLMAALIAAGAFHPRGPDLQGALAARWALHYAVLFAFTALGEESLTRGYAMFALAQRVGFWPAALALSLLFGAGHLGNRGEEWIGIANAVLAGVVFAY